MFADTPAWPASALDRWPGVFPNGVFIHLYLCEQQSCWTRVKIQCSQLWGCPQVRVNPPSRCLLYKFSKNTRDPKHSLRETEDLKHGSSVFCCRVYIHCLRACRTGVQKSEGSLECPSVFTLPCLSSLAVPDPMSCWGSSHPHLPRGLLDEIRKLCLLYMTRTFYRKIMCSKVPRKKKPHLLLTNYNFMIVERAKMPSSILSSFSPFTDHSQSP